MWYIEVDIEVNNEMEEGNTRSSALAAPRRQDLAIMRGVDSRYLDVVLLYYSIYGSVM